jgi:hypothetical protein
MKRLNICLAGLLISALLVPTASAQDHPGDPSFPEPTVSDWAQDEVNQAYKLGLIPETWANADYQAPITRHQYVEVAMEYVALQQNCDINSLKELVSLYLAQKTEDGYIIDAFSDGDTEDSLAYYLGLINGRGDGTFDPDGLITRQEAAVVLTRAYKTCGGALSDRTASSTPCEFADMDKIASWARDSVSALASWSVIKGMDDGTFSPNGNYTIEQCLITFFRLYQDAPVSRKDNNISPLFTYNQGINFVIARSQSTYKTIELDSSIATFVRVDLGGMMRATSSLYLIYHECGVRLIDPVVWDTPYGFTPNQELDDISFSDDEKTLCFSITLEKDTPSYGQVSILYKKGTYNMTVDVITGISQMQYLG